MLTVILADHAFRRRNKSIRTLEGSKCDINRERRSDLSGALMNSTLPATRELARRIIALEAHHDAEPVTSPSGAARVVEKLRCTLAKLAGVAGYRSLLTRAIAMAKTEAPSLATLQVQPDGLLQGFEGIDQKDVNAGVILVAYLLSLLVTFIGKPLTMSLVRDAWPDSSLDDKDLRSEEQP